MSCDREFPNKAWQIRIMRAYAKGQKIQFASRSVDNPPWHDLNDPDYLFDFRRFYYQVRAEKTASELRPQATIADVIEDAIRERRSEFQRLIDCGLVSYKPQTKKEPTMDFKKASELYAALAEGKVLQHRMVGNTKWVDYIPAVHPSHTFFNANIEWRIKPEPREFFLIAGAEGDRVFSVHTTRPPNLNPLYKAIKVREVLED